MTSLTLEALYTLHLFNDRSDNLAFLPLPAVKDEASRKAQLKDVVTKGYQDLKDIGLLKDNKPTEEFTRLAYFVRLYGEHYYHCQVDSNYFCAPAVDSRFERMCVVIKRIDNNSYVIEYTSTVIFLSLLLQEHAIFENLELAEKSYLNAGWRPYAYERLLYYYGRAETIRIKIEQLGRYYGDHLFFNTTEGLFEYDLNRQMIRSVSPDEMKEMLVKQMKVRV